MKLMKALHPLTTPEDSLIGLTLKLTQCSINRAFPQRHPLRFSRSLLSLPFCLSPVSVCTCVFLAELPIERVPPKTRVRETVCCRVFFFCNVILKAFFLLPYDFSLLVFRCSIFLNLVVFEVDVIEYICTKVCS